MKNCSDDDYLEQKPDGENQRALAAASLLETPPHLAAVEHKKGYMMRKCCYESNYKKSELRMMLISTVLKLEKSP